MANTTTTQPVVITDKNQLMIQYLMTCPSIASSPLYFNFAKGEGDDKQFVTAANEKTLNTTFIDGSVMKRFTFTIIDFRSVIYQALPSQNIDKTENVEEFLDIQGIIDWINTQNDIGNFPYFGEDCVVEEIRTASENPNLNGVDTSANPALAKYSISIQVDYIDTSKCLWKQGG